MMPLESLVGQLYSGQERMTRDEIQRRAVAAELPAETLAALDALPEGEYAHDEVVAALVDVAGTKPEAGTESIGIPAQELADDDMFRELESLHRTRSDTLRHGSDDALQRHTERTDELEAEYRQRFPEREVDPNRERAGARERDA